MTDMVTIERMTLEEYAMRQEAYALSQVDKTQTAYISAWAERAAQAVNADGTYQFQNIADAFNAKAVEQEILHPKPQQEMNPELVKIAKRLMQYRQTKGGA